VVAFGRAIGHNHKGNTTFVKIDLVEKRTLKPRNEKHVLEEVVTI
jgi:hypothetical protein